MRFRAKFIRIFGGGGGVSGGGGGDGLVFSVDNRGGQVANTPTGAASAFKVSSQSFPTALGFADSAATVAAGAYYAIRLAGADVSNGAVDAPKLAWASSDASIASVSGAGVVTR